MDCIRFSLSHNFKKMTNIARLTLAALFMLAIYLLISIAIKFYVGWVINLNIIWIILITIFALTIPRLILNRIPFVIGKLTSDKSGMLRLASIISWVVRVLYLLFIFLLLDIHNTKNIIACVFSYLLFYAFSNFFAHGIVHHVLIQEYKQDDNIYI